MNVIIKREIQVNIELVDLMNNMNTKENPLFFFIGTEAELIKIFLVILEAKKRGIYYEILSSGQNDISDSKILKFCNDGKYDVLLSNEDKINKNTIGLLSWFLTTKKRAKGIFKNHFQNIDTSKTLMVVHGDTISTVMGAQLATKFGITVGHIEAGLRSHNLLDPFPEEIDRMIVFRKARLHFAPGMEPMQNLKAAKGIVINTEINTICDSMSYSKGFSIDNDVINSVEGQKYFVFVLHRQENLMNSKMVCNVLNRIREIAKKIKCVMILHEPTRIVLKKLNFLDEILNDENIIAKSRMEYFDFMKLLWNAEFVITDGGSNQEELHYMGKPCLILRTRTERNEGLGTNARLFMNNFDLITQFVDTYQDYRFDVVNVKERPSEIIIDAIEEYFANG